MNPDPQRALYVSHTGMSEPLGRSQVVPSLRGLGRAGWGIDIVAFEPPTAATGEIAALTEELGGDGIGYRWTRRSPSHALGVKLAEALRAFVALVTRALHRRPRIIHARSYLPAAAARAAAALCPGARFLFDCRGLAGDEYVDFGHWARDSLRYRLVKAAERRLFGGADAVVSLTYRLRRWLLDEARLVDACTPVEVIPCCVDLERFRFDAAARARARQRMGAGDRLVVTYSGTLGAWYCEAEMAQLFAAIRRRRPALFAIFTRADSTRLRAELRRAGVPDEELFIQPAGHGDMPELLSGADVGIFFAEPRFSKIASSPVKVPEYLAVGLPVVLNRGVGDLDELIRAAPDSLVDAGRLGARELDAAAARVASLPPLDEPLRARQRALAARRFALDTVGVARYRDLYARLAG